LKDIKRDKDIKLVALKYKTIGYDNILTYVDERNYTLERNIRFDWKSKDKDNNKRYYITHLKRKIYIGEIYIDDRSDKLVTKLEHKLGIKFKID